MSFDIALWKLKKGKKISPGLCYLLIVEGVEFPEVEFINQEEFYSDLLKDFPHWEDPHDEEFHFDCVVMPTGIVFNLTASTPTTVIDWIENYAGTHDLYLFDPQKDPITPKDEKKLASRLKKIMAVYEKEHWKDDLERLTQQADSGNVKAFFELGNRYSFGQGVKKNLKKAFKLYKIAAYSGNPDAMFNLAACYQLGEGTDKDILSAIHWYKRAAMSDKIFAPFALGEIFALGEDILKDEKKAIRYFQIALEAGHQDARKKLRELGALPPLATD